MGYAYYDTPLGPAGYSVEDTCHQVGCDVAIDRGLGFLCGNSPGRSDEVGCGEWFCGEHLRLPVDGCLNGTCQRCWEFWEKDQLDTDDFQLNR
jgi:hypothetical protein